MTEPEDDGAEAPASPGTTDVDTATLTRSQRTSLAHDTTFECMRPEHNPPYLWGKKAWAVDGVGSPEPDAKPTDPYFEFAAIIRLAPLDTPVEIPSSWDGDWLRNGDSNYNLPTTVSLAPLPIVVADKAYVVEVTLNANAAGRLGAITVRVPQAQRSLDAYRVARGVFDGLRMTWVLEQGVTIRESAIAVWRADGEVRIGRFSIGFPTLDLDLSNDFPSSIMQRIVAPYVSALESRTEHYAFLVLFSLLEFLMTPWIGAMKKSFEKRGAVYPKRPYILDQPEVGMIAPWMKGKTFHDVLSEYRFLRNLAGGGHFSFSMGPRAGTVRTDDEVACIADVLRVAVKSMLMFTRDDLTTLATLGASDEAALTVELEGYLEATDGHKRAAAKKKMKKRK